MLPLLVVSTSMVLQVAAGIRALLLVRYTPERLCWGLVAAGLWGMALRRAVALAELAKEGSFSRLDLPYETVGLFTSLCMFLGVLRIAPLFRRIREAEAAREATLREKEEMLARLRESTDKVKLLSGLLPICASCKMIRDEEGRWHPMEGYIQTRTEAKFSHGLCPECIRSYYPGNRSAEPGTR